MNRFCSHPGGMPPKGGPFPGMGNQNCRNKKPPCPQNWTPGKVLGLSMLIIGATVLCAVILPSGICLVFLGGVMIYCGYKLFK
ncbi:MAG: hypothetical protein IJO79_02885 [Firmicutes bacterium]|nr:hypothetical protein [Bacillota bacterium]